MFVFYFICICAPLAVMNCYTVLMCCIIMGYWDSLLRIRFFLPSFFDVIVWHIILIACDPDIHDSQNLHAFWVKEWEYIY